MSKLGVKSLGVSVIGCYENLVSANEHRKSFAHTIFRCINLIKDKSDIIENLLFPSGGTNIDLQLESPGDSTRARASVNQYNDSNASRDTNVCENNKAPSSTRLKGMATGGEDNKSDKLHVNNHFDDSDDIQEIPNLEENTDESVKFIAAPAPNEESLILPTWEELVSSQ